VVGAEKRSSKVVGGSGQRKPTIPESERKRSISGVVGLTGGGSGAVDLE